eukprot:TRINITY_DN4221_c0_g1_i2.p1 TRINITY_DN4221_c0_g1~~TRINITY_DN4221_c0_g1_i2.p1  ORF type:complete len:371 (-),score=67.29 TRINITY_DN4221_c0_g1_i2:61-1173(-)
MAVKVTSSIRKVTCVSAAANMCLFLMLDSVLENVAQQAGKATQACITEIIMCVTMAEITSYCQIADAGVLFFTSASTLGLALLWPFGLSSWLVISVIFLCFTIAYARVCLKHSSKLLSMSMSAATVVISLVVQSSCIFSDFMLDSSKDCADPTGRNLTTIDFEGSLYIVLPVIVAICAVCAYMVSLFACTTADDDVRPVPVSTGSSQDARVQDVRAEVVGAAIPDANGDMAPACPEEAAIDDDVRPVPVPTGSSQDAPVQDATAEVMGAAISEVNGDIAARACEEGQVLEDEGTHRSRRAWQAWTEPAGEGLRSEDIIFEDLELAPPGCISPSEPQPAGSDDAGSDDAGEQLANMVGPLEYSSSSSSDVP